MLGSLYAATLEHRVLIFVESDKSVTQGTDVTGHMCDESSPCFVTSSAVTRWVAWEAWLTQFNPLKHSVYAHNI